MYKVLLVDDEILVREAISAKIEWGHLGFELVGDCENGKAAIEFLKENPVDVVLTDICMPYLDGMGLSKYIYENMPQTRIIIFSGYSDFEYAKQAIQYKVAEYLLKPVTAKELTEVLTRIREKLDSERTEEERIDALQKAYRTYTKNEALIISKTLSRLLQGTQAIETSMEELKEFGIELGGAFYRVVTTDIDVYSSLYDTNDELKKESALMSFVVENISNEIVSDYNAGIAYRDSDSRVCMLLWSDNPKEFSQEIQVICREIQKTVKEAMQLSVSIGIGFCVEKLEELPKSYESAVATLKYRYTKGSGQVYDCESPMSCGNLLELEQDFKDIEEAAKNQQSEELMDILDHVEKWISHGYVTRNQAVSWLRQIMMIIYGVVRRANEDFQMDERDIGDVMESRSFTNAMEKVRAYVKRAMEAMEMAGQSSGERWARLALEYLKKNYGNPSLSLNDVCEHLNISTSRFSSVFKEATGKTFTEALNGIRMDRAKQLLRETSLKNYEIAEKVAPGCDGMVFLPYMSGERSPIWDPDAKGVYYGLDFSKKKGHLIRAAMEGTAYALKHNLEAAEEAGAKVEVLKAMGGAANSHLWTQIKSDVTGKTMEVPSSDTATTLGAALLAGVGVGMYESFEEAVEKTVNKGRVHTPNVEHKEIHEKNYETYRALYEQLKSLMKKTGGKKQ